MDGQTHRLNRHIEAISWLCRRYNGTRGVAIAPEHALQQVTLLGFSRHTSARSRALNIGDDQRQLHRVREVNGLAFEGNARATRTGQANTAPKGRPNRGAHRGNFIFRLEGFDPKMFILRDLMQHFARRGNRIGGIEEGFVEQACCRYKAHGRGLGPSDVAVCARR